MAKPGERGECVQKCGDQFRAQRTIWGTNRHRRQKPRRSRQFYHAERGQCVGIAWNSNVDNISFAVEKQNLQRRQVR